MLHRFIDRPFSFTCITDQPSDSYNCMPAKLPTWWAKLQVFELARPCFLFDLDIVITKNLSPLLDWDGFGIIKDWNEFGTIISDHDISNRIVTPMFNSSVIKLTGNERHVWDEFKPVVMQRYAKGGDQRWITRCMLDAPTFPPEWFASYKNGNCVDGPPDDALAVIFHGYPKPHEFKEGWVADSWRMDVRGG